MLRHWSQFVPNMSAGIRGHEALLHHHQLCILQFNILLLGIVVLFLGRVGGC